MAQDGRRLITVEQCVTEAIQRRRQRESSPQTGVECPGCERELKRVLPTIQSRSETVYYLAACACGKRVWLPEY